MSESRESETPVDWNKVVIEEFRAKGGKVGGQFEGFPLLLLHTTGARSRHERVNPVAYLELDGRLFVFASKGGAHTHPDWFHNLRRHPKVTVELGEETFAAEAVALGRAERDRVYAIQSERYPGFAEYQSKTSRVIPVVELTRVPAAAE